MQKRLASVNFTAPTHSRPCVDHKDSANYHLNTHDRHHLEQRTLRVSYTCPLCPCVAALATPSLSVALTGVTACALRPPIMILKGFPFDREEFLRLVSWGTRHWLPRCPAWNACDAVSALSIPRPVRVWAKRCSRIS